jgi:predicted glycoside hydrolase/deacetylase ChbG (UPF0249 family)
MCHEPCGTALRAVRRVVLHADDYGMNPAVSDGILDGFQRGLLTSTSILSNAPDAARALAAWKRLGEQRRGGCLPSSPRRRRLRDPEQDFDLGVHLNLTQGRPLGGERFPAELLDGAGRLPGIAVLFRRLCRHGRRFAAALEEELRRQIEFVLDHGHRPAHLSGHQYVEFVPLVGRIVPSLLMRYRIPAVRVAVETNWLRSLGRPGIGLSRWLAGSVRWFYARRFRAGVAAAAVRSRKRPGVEGDAVAGLSWPDAFFGSLSGGRVELRQIRSFLAAARRFRSAEIVLHPGRPPEGPAGCEADAWADPWAERRPRELRLLLSDELAECLEHASVRLGRMALAGTGA